MPNFGEAPPIFDFCIVSIYFFLLAFDQTVADEEELLVEHIAFIRYIGKIIFNVLFHASYNF